MLRFKHYVIDVGRGCLRTADQEVALRPKSFEVLRYLVASGGRLVSKDEMLKALWPDAAATDESLAQCVSEVRRAIDDGDQGIIKTVPRRGYRFLAPVRPIEPPVDAAAIAPGRDRRPALAVLPFTNLGQRPQQDYFSDGITDDLITELSRFSELMVIARNSTFRYKGRSIDVRTVGRELGARYVLEGSIRRQSGRVRVTVQLLDADTGGHLWAERYDRGLADILAVQDELARAIAAILAVRLGKAEAERALLKAPSSCEVYELYLRAAEAYRLRGRVKTSVLDARRLLQEALALDSDYARAYALLSKTHWWAYVEPLNEEYLDPAALARAHEFARKAVELAPELPEAHAQLGWALLFEREHEAGLAEFEHAFALNRNFVDNRFCLALAYAGMPRRAIDMLQARIHLDPFQPFDSFGFLGHAQYMLARYRDAAQTLSVYSSRAPIVRILPLWLAAAYAQAGDRGRARAASSEVVRIEPQFTIDRWRRTAVYKSSDDAEHLVAGLRKAGLPGNSSVIIQLNP